MKNGPDLLTVDLEWRITLAKEGDGELLAELLGSEHERDQLLQSEPRAKLLWDFLGDVVAGKIKLPPPRKLTYEQRRTRYWREKWVVRGVDAHMGKRRDKSERALWTRKLCEVYGTTPIAVADFKRNSRRRRS